MYVARSIIRLLSSFFRGSVVVGCWLLVVVVGSGFARIWVRVRVRVRVRVSLVGAGADFRCVPVLLQYGAERIRSAALRVSRGSEAHDLPGDVQRSWGQTGARDAPMASRRVMLGPSEFAHRWSLGCGAARGVQWLVVLGQW